MKVAGLMACWMVFAAAAAVEEDAGWKQTAGGVLLAPFCTNLSHDTNHPYTAGNALARLDDGSVMAVYSAPAVPNNPPTPPGGTWLACRTTADGGKTWTPEREILRDPESQVCGASLLRTRDGVLHMFYLGYKNHVWKDGNPTPDDQSDIWTVRSRDNGQTWTKPQRVFEGYSGATNGAIELGTGSIVVPFSQYVSNPGRLVSRTAVSKDGGETWALSNVLDIGGAGDHDGAIEPTIIALRDQRVWMLMRTTRDVFWESFSEDGGMTWSAAAATSIGACSAPGYVTRLADGRLILTWNRGTGWDRKEMSVAFSEDDGKTWTDPVVVAKGREVTYPFVLENGPGDLWISFLDVHGWESKVGSLVVRMAEQALLESAAAVK